MFLCINIDVFFYVLAAAALGALHNRINTLHLKNSEFQHIWP